MSDGLPLVVPASGATSLIVPTAVSIPATIDEAVQRLDGVTDLLSAGNWATAAIVYAYTEDGTQGGDRTNRKNEVATCEEFAALGIRGLKSGNSVRKYRRAWQSAIEEGWAEEAEPGQEVNLPSEPFKAGSGGDDDGDEWFTPRWLFDAIGVEFSIDVCSPQDRTHVATPAKRHYTIDDNGLVAPWRGMVWCNPPYSNPAPWAYRCIEHNDGLLLVHMPMNAGWCVDVWHACAGIRLFQAIEFVRPDGSVQRPGYWLQLAAFGDMSAKALSVMEVPPEVAANPRRVPSPIWRRPA